MLKRNEFSFLPTELCHAYKELHEPILQRVHSRASQSDAQSDANETMVHAEDFGRALEYDLRPTACRMSFWFRPSMVHMAADAVTHTDPLQRDSFTGRPMKTQGRKQVKHVGQH